MHSLPDLPTLRRIFPGDACLTEPEELLAFGSDASRLSAAPLAVVRPERAEQVCELLRWAQAGKVPVYTRGRGTGRVGNAVPQRGGVVVSMLRMNAVLAVDPDDFVAEAEPGAITADLQEAARAKGLYYPPDPASSRYSTVGGNVATCAGGMRAVKYGVTRDYVLGLDAVIPGGELLRLGGRCHKNVAGLDLTRLFVGSSGSLGVMTRLVLKLLPLPSHSASLLACFASLDAAMSAASAAMRSGVLPCSLEFMDRMTLEALAALDKGSLPPWPCEAGAALLFKVDGTAESVASEISLLKQAVQGLRPLSLETAATPAAEDRLWELRRMVSQALFRLAPDKSAEDVALPRGRVAQAVRAFGDIGARLGLRVACFGHLGDGNVHVNVLFDATNHDQAQRARQTKEQVLREALNLGGTLSGEHGLGLTKGEYLAWQAGPAERSLMARVKAAFDPDNIMNPGKEWGVGPAGPDFTKGGPALS